MCEAGLNIPLFLCHIAHEYRKLILRRLKTLKKVS